MTRIISIAGRRGVVTSDWCIGQSVNGGWFALMFAGIEWFLCDGIPSRESALRIARACTRDVEHRAADRARLGALALAHE